MIDTQPRSRTDRASGLRTIVNAVENASSVPLTSAGIVAILEGKGGHPTHVRIVFSDVPSGALERAGAALGVGFATILDAYVQARVTVAAANPDLDAALEERW